MRGSSFVAILCLLLATTSDGLSSKKKRKKTNDTVHERKLACESQTCGHLLPLEAKNCVNECVSAACYRKTFAEPLEDGEINLQLSKNFMACARRDLQASTTSKRRSERERASSSSKSAAAASVAADDAATAAGASNSSPREEEQERAAVLPDGSTGTEESESDSVDAADGDDDGAGVWEDDFNGLSDGADMEQQAIETSW
ncbi:unnamed protein product [Scytosiphon promiscuus]